MNTENRRRWTDAERAFLVETHTTHTAVEQARALGRDYDTLCYQRQRLIKAGLIAPHTRRYARVYTPQEDATIVEMVQDGRSLAAIARRLGRSYSSLYSHIDADLGGLKALRCREVGAIRTPREVAQLFGYSRQTIRKWIDRGWLRVTRNRVGTYRLRKAPALIADDAIQTFMARRDLWPAWHPADITDPDWRDYGRALRAAAGGHWVTLAAVAARSGVRLTRIYAWVRAGKLGDLDTLTYGMEILIWSTDVETLIARLRADRYTGRRNRWQARAGRELP